MSWKSIRTLILLGGLPLIASVGWAQATTAPQSAPSDLLQKYQNAVLVWEQVGFGHAVKLFGLLAAIEVSWLASTLALERDSIESWLAPVIKKLMTIGFFWMILSSHTLWLPVIINSFTQVGQEAGGVGNLSPSGMLFTGLKICGNMLSAAVPKASTSVAAIGASLIPGVGTALTAAMMVPALIVVVCALLVFVAYVVVTIAFVMATIESYIALGAGIIFLGCGAARWTVPYVERYFSLVVSTGVRLMVLYMIIGLGQSLGDQWAKDASNLTLSTQGCQALMGIAAGALTYMAVAWSVPKLVSSVVSGSVSMGAGEMFGAATAVGVGALSAGVGIATAGAGIAAMGAGAAATGAGAAAAGSGAAAMSGTAAASLGGTLGAGSLSSVGATGGAASGAGSALMSTEAATQTAVNPLAAAGPSTDSIGSVVAQPPAIDGGSAAGAVQNTSSGGSGSTESARSGGVMPTSGSSSGSGSSTISSVNSSSPSPAPPSSSEPGGVTDGGGISSVGPVEQSAAATSSSGVTGGGGVAPSMTEASGNGVSAPSNNTGSGIAVGGQNASTVDAGNATSAPINGSADSGTAPSTDSAKSASSGERSTPSAPNGSGAGPVDAGAGQSPSATDATEIAPPDAGADSGSGQSKDKEHPLTRAAQAMQNLRSEAQVLSEHAPNEGPAISAPTLNIHHGE